LEQCWLKQQKHKNKRQQKKVEKKDKSNEIKFETNQQIIGVFAPSPPSTYWWLNIEAHLQVFF
jgi:hypothetical protein